MLAKFRREFILASILLLVGLFFVQNAQAASLQAVSDTISTSRPSAATTLTLDQAANATSVQVFDQNSTLFLASDSATLWPSTGETLNVVNVASMSASGVPSAGNRIIYFTNSAANTHHNGDAITSAVTATHTIKFTTVSAVPGSGHIVITFPGIGQTSASPSASTFSFNGLTNANAGTYIQVNNATCSSWSVTAPTINCTLNATGIPANATVNVIIGCTAQSGGTCTTFSPILINPTKSATTGTADTWKVGISTLDNNSVVLDSSKAIVGTIEAVQVQATVEPTMTFTIAGIADNTTFNSVNASCGNLATDKTNSGISATATFVNLGVLSNGGINMAGQTLTVSTNGSAGYAITATSSGHLINPASGFWLPDANGGNGLTANNTPVPAAMTAGTAAFGISPCGAHVPSSSPNWGGTSGTITGGTALLSNPWNTGTNGYYATIASYTGGPVTGDQTVVRYAGTVSGTTPAGIYTTVYTYVATPTF